MDDKAVYRYFMHMAYMGTHHNGWQVQSAAPTIQGDTERALSILLREEVRLTGAGRTDTGVHAQCFYAHFDSSHSPEQLESKSLAFKCNRILPHSIAVYEIFPVHPKAHARFHATSRTYHYFISTRKDPFWRDRAWTYERKLDVHRMQEATQCLLQHSDFSSFARSNTQVKTHICRIDIAEWQTDGHILRFRIRADRFLRNMVRAITGTLTDVGLGKLSVGCFNEIIEARDRNSAGYSAPACGLHLVNIDYPDKLFQGFHPAGA